MEEGRGAAHACDGFAGLTRDAELFDDLVCDFEGFKLGDHVVEQEFQVFVRLAAELFQHERILCLYLCLLDLLAREVTRTLFLKEGGEFGRSQDGMNLFDVLAQLLVDFLDRLAFLFPNLDLLDQRSNDLFLLVLHLFQYLFLFFVCPIQLVR